MRFPTKVVSKLSYLATNVSIGDFQPADSYYEVFEMLTKQLMKKVTEMLQNKDVGPIIIG